MDIKVLAIEEEYRKLFNNNLKINIEFEKGNMNEKSMIKKHIYDKILILISEELNKIEIGKFILNLYFYNDRDFKIISKSFNDPLDIRGTLYDNKIEIKSFHLPLELQRKHIFASFLNWLSEDIIIRENFNKIIVSLCNPDSSKVCINAGFQAQENQLKKLATYFKYIN